MYDFESNYETDVVEIRHWTDITTRAAISKVKEERYREGWTLIDIDYGGGISLGGGKQLRGTQVIKLYFRRKI